MIKTEGIVLSKRNSYNEDVFLTLFTEKYGKMNVVVKRSKSYRSSLNASTRVFVCSDFILRPASIPLIVSADIIHSNLKLLDDLDHIISASYLCEIVNLTTVEAYCEKRIYYLLKEGLRFLSTGEVDPLLLRAFFLVQLCVELGVMPTSIEDEMSLPLRELSALPRCLRFVQYLSRVDYPRLRHTKKDKGLFADVVKVGEMILKETLDISDIKSNQLMI